MKPIFNKRIFWDVDFEALNYDENPEFIITRVITRGDVDDIRQCRRFYGDEIISDILLNTNFLPEIKLYLASAIINKDITEFKCYKNRQSNPELYPY